MKLDGAPDALRVPSRRELIDILSTLPFVQADEEALVRAADYVRRVFRQPGSDDLSLTLRTPEEGWDPEPEGNCAANFSKLAKHFEQICGLLEELPSNGWQALDGAELAALNSYSERAYRDYNKLGLPRIRLLLEGIANDARILNETLLFAAEFEGVGGDKYRTHAFADAAAYAFNILTGQQPTRRYDAYKEIEHGPFLQFVDALRGAFNHPASSATLSKSAVTRWRLQYRMDNRKQKSR